MAKQNRFSRRSFLRASAGAAAATSVYGLSACAGPNQAAPQAAPTVAAAATAPAAAEAAPAQSGKLQVAWVAQQQAAQSDQRALQGFEDWMAQNGVDWDVAVTDAKGDPGTLSNMVSDAVTRQVDAIIVAFGTLTAAQGALQQVAASGIPFFSIDSGYFAPAICDVASDNYVMGANMGSYLVQRMQALGKTEPNICTIIANFHHGTRKRGKVLDVVLSENENIKVLDSRIIQYDKFFETTLNTVNDWLTRFQGQIDAIWCPWDEPAMAASQAILSRGLSVDDIIVIGADGHPPAVEEMRKPEYPLVCTCAQAFELWGALVGTYVRDIVEQKKPVKEIVPVPTVSFPAPFIVKEVNLPEPGLLPWQTTDFFSLYMEAAKQGLGL